MKRFLIAIVILFGIVGLAYLIGSLATGNEVDGGKAPSIRVDGVVYHVTREVALIYPENSEVSGHISSTVSHDQFPEKNDQANFNCKGQPYIWIDGTLYFKGVNASWYICQKSNSQ